MTTQKIIAQLLDMDKQADILTKAMDQLVRDNDVNLPEELEGAAENEYSTLFQQRQRIHEFQNRIGSICGSYAQFAFADLH